MKAEEYFNSQADFNKWLKELTEHEKSHVIEMLEEYAVLNAPSPVIDLESKPVWVKASDKSLPDAGRMGNKLHIKYKGVPDLLMSDGLCWCWLSAVRNLDFRVQDDSLSAIEWLDETTQQAPEPCKHLNTYPVDQKHERCRDCDAMFDDKQLSNIRRQQAPEPVEEIAFNYPEWLIEQGYYNYKSFDDAMRRVIFSQYMRYLNQQP